MNLTPEQREAVANELKKVGADLQLSEEQKGKLHTFLTESYATIQEYKTQNPNASKEEIVKKIVARRSKLRERLVNFLTPEQLQKSDSGVGRAKEFLGQKLAA